MDERAKKHHLSAVSSRFCRDTACLIIPMPAIAGFWSTLRASGQSTYPTPYRTALPLRAGPVASLPCSLFLAVPFFASRPTIPAHDGI
jgi:hypothetical protein